ncbi:MAG: HNH endonuclease [Nanoarchaeota archaeon]
MKSCEFCNRSNKETNVFFNKKLKKFICNKHNHQMVRKGKIYRSNQEPNLIYFEDNIAKIQIKYKNRIFYGIIDKEDYEKIKSYKWYYNKTGGYIRSQKKENGILKRYMIHNIILKPKKNLIIDHIDRNPLNNRKKNLRYATYSQNISNSKIAINNTTGYKGLFFNKKNQKWTASIWLHYTQIFLGSFKDKKDAIKARKEAEIKYFGEFRLI